MPGGGRFLTPQATTSQDASSVRHDGEWRRLAYDVRAMPRKTTAALAADEEGIVSYPYPQDRHLDRKEKGNQPYQDAKEAMAQAQVQIQTEAEAFGEARRDETEEERNARIAAEAQEDLRAVNEEIAGQQGTNAPAAARDR